MCVHYQFYINYTVALSVTILTHNTLHNCHYGALKLVVGNQTYRSMCTALQQLYYKCNHNLNVQNLLRIKLRVEFLWRIQHKVQIQWT